MWNFMWLDIDSSLQTNDSKWLDSFCDSILTRLDQVMTLTRLEKILDDSDSTLNQRACDSYSTKMTRSHHCWTSSSKPLEWSNAQNKVTFKCWSCHAFNVVHQLSSFCAIYFEICTDEVVLLIFVLQTFSWNHSPIYFVCSPLSSLQSFLYRTGHLVPTYFTWNILKHLRYFVS